MGKIEVKKHEILTNRLIAKETWEITLDCDTRVFAAPGQFVNIQVEGCYLRRPLSVAMAENGIVTLVYKVVGTGTRTLSEYKAGNTLDLLYPLGNGFDTQKCKLGQKIVLVGGGAGVPPLYGLARKLRWEGKQPQVILGFGTAAEAFYIDRFQAMDCLVTVSTLDGSLGMRGNVLDAARGEHWEMLYACGPEAMLYGVRELGTRGEFSFESRMGCGFGACMGCSCQTKYGEKRICTDGPVLTKEEIIW